MRAYAILKRTAVAPLLTLTLALAGCGGGDGWFEGTVRFELDRGCRAPSYTIDFYVDDRLVGTETLAPGQRSREYDADIGGVLLAARSTSGLVWANAEYQISLSETYTLKLQCPAGQ